MLLKVCIGLDRIENFCDNLPIKVISQNMQNFQRKKEDLQYFLTPLLLQIFERNQNVERGE